MEEKLCQLVGADNVKISEPMKKHTTFRIGGPADYFITPENADQLEAVIRLLNAEQIPFYIVGNGSNLLVGDKGFRGAVIQIFQNMNTVVIEDDVVRVQAGALLSKVAAEALNQELTGFEFAAGIPGTIGGAVMMNAGAYGGEMKDVLKSATVLSRNGEIRTVSVEDMELGYRSSIFSKNGDVVLDVVLQLKRGNSEQIRSYMDELKEKRVTKQPLEYPSAGSTFKRPEGYFAGKLIEDAGLRGFQVGGAQVSEKHCGFVINKENATAEDVMSLIRQVSEIVNEKFGVTLEPEVKRIGEF